MLHSWCRLASPGKQKTQQHSNIEVQYVKEPELARKREEMKMKICFEKRKKKLKVFFNALRITWNCILKLDWEKNEPSGEVKIEVEWVECAVECSRIVIMKLNIFFSRAHQTHVSSMSACDGVSCRDHPRYMMGALLELRSEMHSSVRDLSTMSQLRACICCVCKFRFVVTVVVVVDSLKRVNKNIMNSNVQESKRTHLSAAQHNTYMCEESVEKVVRGFRWRVREATARC